jgi:MFS transporter, DHA2 family, multidrug resistance protein
MGGLIVAAAGELVLSRMPAVGGVTILLTGLCIVMLGTSPVGTLSSQLVMSSAPPGRAGSAGSLSGASGEFGSALGVAVFGSLVTVFYGGHVRLPDGVSAATATAANDSLAHAIDAAGRLPGSLAEQVLGAARFSFNAAVNNIAVLSAVLFAALAVLVIATLRGVRPIGAEPAESDETE